MPGVHFCSSILASLNERRPSPVWKSNFGHPTPSTRYFSVAASARNLTHWLISTQLSTFGDPSALRSVATPDASRPAASGSASTIFTSGIAAFRALPAPVRKSSISRSLLSRIATQVCAVEGAARAVARHPVRELLARRLEISDDFGAGRGLVELPVRLVLEPVGKKISPCTPSTRRKPNSVVDFDTDPNWWQRNQPFLAQSSSALRTMPVWKSRRQVRLQLWGQRRVDGIASMASRRWRGRGPAEI